MPQVDESLSPVEAILKYGRSDHPVQRLAYIRVGEIRAHTKACCLFSVYRGRLDVALPHITFDPSGNFHDRSVFQLE